MDELLLKYADKFNENFPMYLFRAVNEKEIKAVIQNCLDDNIPYNAEIKNSMKY